MKNVMSFEKFMYSSKLRKSLGMLAVKGVVKGHLLWRDMPFDIVVYYTPLKKKIIDFDLGGMDMKHLETSFSIGDDIQKIKDWAKEKGYEMREIAKY